MVSLLIVSHSAQLAAGVKEFVDQATQGAVKVVATGGTVDGGIGTSVDKILDGLREAASPDGTLVMVDLAGAVISVETALDAYSDGHVTISDAPLVEGAYLAAVEASTGVTLEEAAAAALQARDLVKVHQ